MNKKFDTIYESNFSRFQGGGFLTGDVIKLKDGWNNDEWCKGAPAQVVDKIRELADSDLILRVSSVKPLRPAVNSSVDQAMGVDDFYIDVAQELSPGGFSGNFVTVPQALIELSGDPSQLPELPDSLRREDEVDIKPGELEDSDTSNEDGTGFTCPKGQTGMDDKTNKKLTDKDIKQPGVTGAVSYTAGYIK